MRQAGPKFFWRLASGVVILTACTAGNQPSTTSQSGWHWGIDTVDLGNAYAIGPCIGEADQFACITLNNTVVGSAERLSLPVSNFDFLADTDDPLVSIELIASDYLASFNVDRETTCPDLEFEQIGPDRLIVAGQPGLRFGFSQTKEGDVVEKNLVYGIRTRDTVHLFNLSATAEGSCVGVAGPEPQVLDQLTPNFERAIATLILDL
jgi:hypothetical protein